MKRKRRIIALIVIVLILIILTIIIKAWPKTRKQGEVQIINKIDGYGYVLEDNETVLHKKYFDELVDALKGNNVDEEAYAELVVKLFISDFYNLDNKITKNDVGGVQYVYTPSKDNMILKAKDTIYKYIESDIDSSRKQKLPIVSDVEIKTINQIEFEYGDETDEEAYEVNVSWTYKENLDYQDQATFKLIHEDNKLSIAELE